MTPPREGPGNAWVVACVDHSEYANSVCDHAGWFASDPDVGVEVLHVVEDSDSRPAASGPAAGLIERAVWRLREEGVGPISSSSAAGSFVEIAADRGGEVIVMGKRGVGAAGHRSRLGSSVDAMVRATATPICLTSKLFLPIHRALVLLDADLTHRGAIEFVMSQPRLSALPLDIVVVAGPGDKPDAKGEWVRATLGDELGDVFSLQADGLDGAVTQYMESRGADLIVVSRAVVTPDPQTRLMSIEERGLWGARTPVLIC